MTPEWLWYDGSWPARAARGLLAPAEGAWRGAVAMRNALYDRGALRARDAGIPVLAVGNIMVGGTGKTPVAAHLAGELRRRGARPAVVLRGVGADETVVHRLLNPEAVVVADPDRHGAVLEAQRLGADIAVLDDGFQHRRLRRDADIVLVDAERWGLTRHCIPAGPLREPWTALRRATGVLVTQKSADSEAADRVRKDLRDRGVHQVGLARLLLDAVHAMGLGDEARPAADLSTLAGLRVLAVSGVGNPAAWEAQLRPRVGDLASRRYADHHAFGPRDMPDLLSRAATADAVVCTLKDAVKLGPLWPRNGPRLLYVSQRVELAAQDGGDWVSGLLDALSTARRQR
jgi:tetraacyldisaccharide 4'-kinase